MGGGGGEPKSGLARQAGKWGREVRRLSVYRSVSLPASGRRSVDPERASTDCG